jgi:hypothetical protein
MVFIPISIKGTENKQIAVSGLTWLRLLSVSCGRNIVCSRWVSVPRPNSDVQTTYFYPDFAVLLPCSLALQD